MTKTLFSQTLPLLMLLCTIALSGTSPTADARKIVCWKNNEGVRECGNAVPPEYAQKSVERKSKMGLTVEKTERAKTQEELAESRREKQRLRKERLEEERIAANKARRDRVLLQTFTTEEDLRLAHNGKVAAIESRVKHGQQRVRRLEESRDALQSEAAQYERAGKKVPDELAKRIDDIQKQLSGTVAQIAQRSKEVMQVQEQFESDLARYRELKGS